MATVCPVPPSDGQPRGSEQSAVRAAVVLRGGEHAGRHHHEEETAPPGEGQASPEKLRYEQKGR